MRGRGHIVWVQYDAGGPWVEASSPMSERQAVKEASDTRAFGTIAKAFPEGVDPNAKAKAS